MNSNTSAILRQMLPKCKPLSAFLIKILVIFPAYKQISTALSKFV